MPESRDEAALADCAVDTLQEFGLKWQKQLEGRPGVIHVEDRTLMNALAARRADLDADVVLVPDLPDLTAVLRHMQEAASGDDRPNLLNDPAITRDHVRVFADAAAQFHRAAPWRLLDNADLLIVEHGRVPRSVSHVSVLGAGGEEFGLGFFDTRAQFDHIMEGGMPDRAFGVTFVPCDELPFGDVDLWEDEHLPVDGEDAYPLVSEVRPNGMRRPSAEELTAIEGLLRALSQVTEDELDGGTWTVEVPTAGGPRRLTLTLPEVVEALDQRTASPSRLGDRDRIQRQLAALLSSREFGSIDEANTALQAALTSGQFDLNAGNEALLPAEEARQWAGRALEMDGRPRAALAQRALALDPDCADTWTALIETAPDADEAITRARKAVEASRRTLGEAAFHEATGSFWMVYETRPYMRALAELARALQVAGQPDAAIDAWQEMLRLNPNDNQGMRYVLFFALLARRRHDDLSTLVGRYENDSDASWRFGHALWVFSRDGETPEAAALLKRAHDANRHVLPLVLGRKPLPAHLPDHYQPGAPDEAAYAASVLLPAIAGIGECGDWLDVQAMSLLRTAIRKPLSRLAPKRKPGKGRKR